VPETNTEGAYSVPSNPLSELRGQGPEVEGNGKRGRERRGRRELKGRKWRGGG